MVSLEAVTILTPILLMPLPMMAIHTHMQHSFRRRYDSVEIGSLMKRRIIKSFKRRRGIARTAAMIMRK